MAGRKRKVVAVNNSTTEKGVSGDSSKRDVAHTTPKIATRASKHAPVNSTQQNNNETLKKDSKNKTPNTKSENVHQAKRQKIFHPEETLKPTRTSARLRARAQTPAPDVPPQLSPKSLDESAEAVLDPVANEAVDDTKADGASELLSSFTEDVGSRLTPKSNDVMGTAETNEPVHQIGNRRKRKLGSESNFVEDSPGAVKKLKIIGQNVLEASAVQVDSDPVREEDQHNQHPEGDENIPELGETDVSIDHDHDMSDHQKSGTTMTRGRGRGGRGRGRGRGKGPINNLIKAGYAMSGRGRGRGAGRGGGRGRGRGGGGGKGGGQGGRHNNGDSDGEDVPERPLPLNPYTQKLSDRQRELKQNFKRLAAAQKLLLAELARRTQQTLARDKNAHREPPEFEEVEAQLNQHLLSRLEILEHEHRLRVQQTEILLEAETRAINDRFEANASNIQDEYFYAIRGNYMSLIEKEQRGDDDEHTEPDLDDPTADQSKSMTMEQQPATSVYEYEPYYLHEPRITRGYSSRMARERGGADAYERGKHGWDDFLQRAKLRELSQEESDANAMHLLLAASREALVDEARPPPLSSVDALPPAGALFALADAASIASRAHVAPSVQTSAVPQSVQAVPRQQLPSLLLQQAPPTRPTLSAANGYPEVYTMNGPTLPPRLPPLPEALSSFSSSRHGHGGDSSLQYHQVLPPPTSVVRIPAAQAPPPYIYPDHTYPPPQAHSAGGRPPPPPSHLGSAIDNYQTRPAHSH